MKQYVVLQVWNHDTAPSTVGHFDSIVDAQSFAELSHKTEPEYNFAVAEVVYVTKWAQAHTNMQKLLLITIANQTRTSMKEKYFLCFLTWDAQEHKEVVSSRSKGYDTVEELFAAVAPNINKVLGRKIFIQKYHV